MMKADNVVFTSEMPSVSYSQFLQTSNNEQHHHLSESSESFVDMEFVRHTLSICYQHLYSTKKKQNWFYRVLFFGFGFLFLLFGILIFFQTVHPNCAMYFNHCSLVKNCVDACCLLLSLGAFAVGYAIHPENEAIRHFTHKVAKELSIPARHMQSEFNDFFHNFSHIIASSKQTVWIKKASKEF